MTIQQKHLSELLREDYTTVQVSLSSSSPSLLTYKVHNSMLSNLAVEDKVVVPVLRKAQAGEEEGKVGFSIGTIKKIDDKPEIDFSATFEYRWVVGRIDFSMFEQINEQEKALNDKLVTIRRQQEKKQILDTVMADLGPEAQLEFKQAAGLTLNLKRG